MARQLHEALIEKLKVASESTLSAEERAARMDEMLKDEEIERQETETELKRLRDLQFKKTQELHQAQVKERNTEAEIQGSRAAGRNLSSKISKLDHDSLKQQEIVYNQVSRNMSFASLQMKVSKKRIRFQVDIELERRYFLLSIIFIVKTNVLIRL